MQSVIASSLLLLLVAAVLQYLVIKKMRGRRKRRDDGLDVLNPQLEDVNVEIVAVHGLGAHLDYTWTHKSASKLGNSKDADRVYLLRDLLMKDERFLEHDSFISHTTLTGSLTLQLNRVRRLVKRVPIIFIGHSFGGIVIKEALCDPSEGSQEIFEDTCGIVFLGTPHNGSPVSGLAATLASLTGSLGSNNGLLLSLRSNESRLSDLSKRFYQCLERKEEKGKKTNILFICENKPTYILQCVSVGLIVPWHSAAFGGNAVEVSKDHSGLNKCNDVNDPLYRELTDRLCKLRPTTKPEINGLQQSIIDRLKIETVTTAIYDPEDLSEDKDKDSPECLSGTRREILEEIRQWFDDDTLTQKPNRLAASFFFKRGLGSDPNLPERALGVQFRKLILEPMQHLSHNTAKIMVVVVDALDECDSEKDIATLIKQLSQPTLPKHDAQKPTSKLVLKFFLTSRPYQRINPTFVNTISSIHENREQKKLEKATKDTIERDIRHFLKFRLGRLIEPMPSGDKWSSPEDVQMLEELVHLACPCLFSHSPPAASSDKFVFQVNQGIVYDKYLDRKPFRIFRGHIYPS
ncbi:hypothetical protein PT974_02857 [Cladobotryum mycophilum]|uniref:Nephrocystin 3-like N-terminal domain-containing protein n=1 Tax=Cladobotryum mycophilum TaxID=491253 RepID=A0ABR0SZD5_9HYPO